MAREDRKYVISDLSFMGTYQPLIFCLREHIDVFLVFTIENPSTIFFTTQKFYTLFNQTGKRIHDSFSYTFYQILLYNQLLQVHLHQYLSSVHR